MNRINLSSLPSLAVALATTLISALSANATNYTWNDPGGNGGDWSTSTNWIPNTTGAGPLAGDTVIFGNNDEPTGPTANNTVDSGTAGAVNALDYTDFELSSSPYVYPSTLIPSGKTLLVTNSFLVGGQTGTSTGNPATYAYFYGGGTLKVTGASLLVADASTSGGGPCAYLNLAGLTNFVYNNPNGSFGISTNGGGLVTRIGGSATLAYSNNITVGAMNLGCTTSAQGGPGLLTESYSNFGTEPNGVQNNGGPITSGNPAELVLGAGTNIINAGGINIGAFKNGFIVANSGGGLRIRGVTGADSDANVNITVGNRNAGGGSGQTTGWLLLNGCPVNIKANAFILGEHTPDGSGSPSAAEGGNGLLAFDTGTISANSLLMADNVANNNGADTAVATGLIQVGPQGTFSIGAGQLFAMATATGSGPAVGILVVSNGVMNCQGPIVMGVNTNSTPPSSPGFASGIIQLIGSGTLNMGPNSYVGTQTNPITGLLLDTNSVFSISIPSPNYTNVCVNNLAWPSPDNNLALSVAAIPYGITNGELFPFIHYNNLTNPIIVNVPGYIAFTNNNATSGAFNNPKVVLPTGVTGNMFSSNNNVIYLTITSGAGIAGVDQLTNGFFIQGSTDWTASGSGASIVSSNSTYPNTGGCTMDTRNIVPLPNTGANVAKLTGSFVAGGSTNIWSESVPVAPGSQLAPGSQVTLDGSAYVAHEDIMSGADSFYFEVDFVDGNNNVLAAYESGILSGLNCSSPILDTWNFMNLTNQMQVTGGVNTGVVLASLTNAIIQVPAGSVNARFKAVFIQRNATDTGSVYFSGANIGFLLAPVPPAVASITPNLVTLSTNQFLSCTVTSSITTISSFQITATTTTLGGTATNTATYTLGSPGFTVSGIGTPSATVTLALATNTIYQSVIITATDADDLAISSSPASFDTLTPVLVIEGADFNYSGGSFIDTPANGGFALYQGLVGTQGIDENKNTRTNIQSYYRPLDATIIQAANSTSGTEQKFVTAAANGDITDIEVAIAFATVGDWLDYSRTFGTSGTYSAQPGTYNVWCYLATTGSGPQLGFYQVTSNPTQPNQTTNLLGNFGGSTFSDSSYNNFVYAPLVDQFGNRQTLTIPSGVQTFRSQFINNNTPNVAFYMLTPVVPVLTPVFLYVNPTTTFQPTNTFEFVVGPAQGASIATNDIGITLNGVTVTSGVTFTSFGTGGWTVTLPLPLNQVYSVVLNVTNLSGFVSTYTNSFDTFSQTNFMIEADAFDFNGGQYITNPIETATAAGDPNSYYYYPADNENNSAEYGIDYTTTNVTGETYLFRVDGNTPGTVSVVADAVGTEVTSDFLRDKFINEGPGAQPPFEYVPEETAPSTNTDYDVGWWPPGTWMNYTRTFPTNTYILWGRLASSAAYNNATVSLVTAGQGTTTQTTQLLGYFVDPNANGFQAWHWIPLTGANGQPVVLSLGGVETLQVTAPSGSAAGSINGHFYMLAPYTAASSFSVKATVNGATVSIQFPTQSGHNYTVYYSTSLTTPNWQALGSSIAGDGTVKTVTDSTTGGAQRFYRAQAQ
jgi:hypothetical protein